MIDFFSYTLGSAAYYLFAFIVVCVVAIVFASAGNVKAIWDAVPADDDKKDSADNNNADASGSGRSIRIRAATEGSSLSAEQGSVGTSKSARWPSSPSSNGGRSGAFSV